MATSRTICLFCGARPGNSLDYAACAEKAAARIHTLGARIVYGGASVGLMGTLADEALRLGVHVTGVIPKLLVDRELAHRGLGDLRIVNDMQERKRLFLDLSDAFLVLPGGMGTLDEIFEVVTWAQLGIHRKSFFILNWKGYYDSLITFLSHAEKEGFIPSEIASYIKVINDLEELSI